MDVARVTTGKIVLTRRPIDLAEAVVHCIASFRAAGKLDDHEVSVATVVAMVDGDMTRLEQVVSNLLGNALKFTPPGGRIAMVVEVDQNFAVLSIKDSGIGIAPSLLSQVFEIFVQGSISLDRRQGGLGIGLSLVKALVEQHHGTITVTSAGEGHGCCFVVRLPLLRGANTA